MCRWMYDVGNMGKCDVVGDSGNGGGRGRRCVDFPSGRNRCSRDVNS